MADTKISALAELTDPAVADEFVVVDKSDPTMGVSGTTKRITFDRLALPISVEAFGAVGDGVTDDAAAIQAAIDYALSSGMRGDVYVPPGTYLLGSTVTVQGAGIALVGRQGELTTILKASHSSGPVVRVKDRRDGLRNIMVDSTAGRLAGAAGSNYGVHIEATDTAGSRPSICFYENLYVQNQPSHGIVNIGGGWLSRFDRVTSRDNTGHGMVFDYGSLTSRTNTEPPGISTIANCEIFDNGGHGILIGNDDDVSNRGIRLRFENVDIYRNAESAGTRKSADQVWAFMDSSSFVNCATDGHNQASSAATTRGILLYGKNNSVLNHRFLNVTPQAARIGGTLNALTSEGNTIDGFWLQGTHQGAIDPAVTIDSDVVSARVWTFPQTNITRLTTTSSQERAVLEKRTRMAIKATAETRTATTTLADDAELFVAVNKTERLSFRATIFFDGPTAGDIKLSFTVPASSTLRWGPAGGIRVDESDAVVVQATVTSGSMNFGAAGVGTVRSAEIVGQLLTAGTAGNLTLQWAQATSDAGNTRVFGQSFITVVR